MLDYKVINNFLPKEIHKKILQTMTAGNFQWYYCDSGGNQKDKERYYFVHIFKSDKVNSDFWISSTGKTHKQGCRYYGQGKGRYAKKASGNDCRICGGAR